MPESNTFNKFLTSSELSIPDFFCKICEECPQEFLLKENRKSYASLQICRVNSGNRPCNEGGHFSTISGC